jgi:hypothetical protein
MLEARLKSTYLVKLPHFWTWGSGGNIKEIRTRYNQTIMENTYFEFQSKGSNAPVFKLKYPDFGDASNLMGPVSETLLFSKTAKGFSEKLLKSKRSLL